MNPLYITNYRDERSSPLDSLTRLSTEDAYSLARKLSQHADASFTSFSRFSSGDFEGYYQKRLRTEEWLYSSFIALGGRPGHAHPLYFVLGESTYLKHWFGEGITTRLLLSDIDPAHISFTYGDSMSKLDSPDRMELFSLESLLHFIRKSTSDIASFLEELNQQNRYIEVQLWSDEYLSLLL